MTKRDVLDPLSRVLLPVLFDSGQRVEMKQDTRKARRGCNLNRRWMYQIAMDMNGRMQYHTLQNSNHTSSIVQSSRRENFTSSPPQKSDLCSRMRQFPTLPIGTPASLTGFRGKWTFHFCDPTMASPPPHLPPFGKSGPRILYVHLGIASTRNLFLF
jgi:hypothetical protein